MWVAITQKGVLFLTLLNPWTNGLSHVKTFESQFAALPLLVGGPLGMNLPPLVILCPMLLDVLRGIQKKNIALF